MEKKSYNIVIVEDDPADSKRIKHHIEEINTGKEYGIMLNVIAEFNCVEQVGDYFFTSKKKEIVIDIFLLDIQLNNKLGTELTSGLSTYASCINAIIFTSKHKQYENILQSEFLQELKSKILCVYIEKMDSTSTYYKTFETCIHWKKDYDTGFLEVITMKGIKRSIPYKDILYIKTNDRDYVDIGLINDEVLFQTGRLGDKWLPKVAPLKQFKKINDSTVVNICKISNIKIDKNILYIDIGSLKKLKTAREKRSLVEQALKELRSDLLL